MTGRSTVGRVKARCVEQGIALNGGRLAIDRGVYARLARGGVSRREVDRALDELVERDRILIYVGASGVVIARLIGGGR